MFKASDLPKNCPPKDAVEKDLNKVYRLVNEPLSKSDFLTHVESDKPYPPHKLCEANALSFFTTVEAAEQLKKRYKKFRNQTALCGDIPKKCGINNIKNNHINLWLYKNIDIQSIFIKEEVGSENV